MDFLKKHFEKILLGVVLLGLAVAVAFLPFVIANEKQRLEDMKTSVLHPKVEPLTNLDLSMAQAALKSVAMPVSLDLGPPNRLFNPMPWQKTADGHLVPQDKVGPSALTIVSITPLFMKLTLDSITPADPGGSPQYIIGIEKPAAYGARKIKTQDYCTTNPPTQNKTFEMLSVNGKPDDPQVIVKLKDTGETAAISTNKPFERIEGYMADLRYEPEKKHWENCRPNVRTSPPLAFNGEEYNVVAINPREVVLAAKSNGKKWTIAANPTNAAPVTAASASASP